MIDGDTAGFRAQVAALADYLVRSPAYPVLLTAKTHQLAAAEQHRPLAAYRAAELAIMSRNFSDPGEPYTRLRRAFVYKDKPPYTPAHLARHRTHPPALRPRQSPAHQATGAPAASRFARERLADGGPGGAREGLGAQTSTPVLSATAAGTQTEGG